jgi:cytochrome b
MMKKIRVWDFPVRLFHFLLVLMCCVSWLTVKIGGNAMQYHLWSGYAVMGLVLFRLLWGFAGSETARFSQFLLGPTAVWRYTRVVFKSDCKMTMGHTPLGGWSVMALLLVLSTQTITGLFANDDITTEGPLSHLVRKASSDVLSVVHQYAFKVLLGLVILHLSAVIFYHVKHRDNRLKPMLTGYKMAAQNAAETKQASLLLAIVLAFISAGSVYWIVNRV